MAQTVVGFFDDASEARRAVEQLTQKGISRDSAEFAYRRSAFRIYNFLIQIIIEKRHNYV